MNVGDRNLLPIACTLSPGAGAAQLAEWQAFNEANFIESDRTPGRVVAHYAKVEDAAARLAELVRTEQSCCGFARWSIDTTSPDLCLTVTATDDALSVLTFLEHAPIATREATR